MLENIETIKFILLLVSVVCSLVITMIVIIKKLKNGNKITVEDTVDTFKSTFDTITNLRMKAIDYMINAEIDYKTIGNNSSKTKGEMKKSQVLNAIKIDCLVNNIEYVEKDWEELINKICEFKKS